MSTAILHSNSFQMHDFGDIILKNQPTGMINNNNSNDVFGSSATLNGLLNAAAASQTTLSNGQTHLTQQHINLAAAFVAASKQHQQQSQQTPLQQQRQQVQQEKMIHNALTRAVSHPITSGVVNNLFTSLNEIMNVGAAVNATNISSGHRKLERTQSEPLPQINTSRYKTELCRPYEEAGECKYGDKCQFAHGMHELRNLQRHPKYKTELCRTFHSVGFCPYGPRCHFVHNAEEARTHNRNVAAYHARLAAQQQAQQQQQTHKLPLSPPLSLSTGSDRASPVGSLSPTTSMGSFFQEQNSPVATFTQIFAFPQSPPASPIILSPGSTPSPPPHQPQQQQNSVPQIHQSGILSNNGNGAAMSTDEARLPVFNRISSTTDAFRDMTL